MAMIECENLVKIYKAEDIEVMALQGLDLVVEEGEFMAMIGKSGSGKSTLLNLLGGLDSPTAGKLWVNGIDMTKITRAGLVKYKRDTVGFVWQNNARNMIPYLTAQENVMLPMAFSGTHRRRAKAAELLDQVGLAGKRNNRLAELSGGE
jgi:ABC-type lipoprotein export system ATPase subunit